MSANSEILIRGDEAARARPVDLVGYSATGVLNPVGPWAGEVRETARDEGLAEGRAEGHELGLQEGRQQAERSHGELAVAVDTLLTQIEERFDELGAHLASETIKLALEIAAAVLEREVAAASDPGADAIARCLDLAPSTGDLVARLHPDDAERLGDVLGLAERALTVVADPRLQAGDAVVTIDETTIDARMAEALRRVGEVLG